MRYGYGYKCSEKDFAHTECDEIFIDHDDERLLRGFMVKDYLRGNAGDEIVLIDASHLGKGNHMSMIEEMNVEVAVEPPPYDPQKRGPKSRFDPDADELKLIKKLWHGPDTPALILPKINKICGYEVPRYVLNYHLGPRDKRKAKKKK